jgi:hypothetical protein
MPDHSPAPPDENNSSRSTGPRSPHGKARSSLNRLTHGCRSEQNLIPGEDPAEFEFTMEAWSSAYDSQDPVCRHLVEETAKAHWILKRNEKWLHQIQVRLPSDAWLWTEENHKLLSNATRYKTTAERSFYRAFNTLEASCKRRADAAALAEKARFELARIQMQWLKKKAEASAAAVCFRQWIQVYTNARGECVTSCAPTNDQILARAASATKPPEFLTRFVSFLNGVPPAYDWTCPNDVQRYDVTTGVQHFTFPDWLAQAEAEKTLATGHLAPFAMSLLDDN